MPKRPKQPHTRSGAQPDRKSVRARQFTAPEHPSWRFSTVDRSGLFAWPIQQEVELKVLQKLRDFDSMRWTDIAGPDHHPIQIDRLSPTARQRLEQIQQDDIDEVFSFHFSGKARIIGIRDQSVVKLLWWDPEHQVCPSPKKHT